MIGTHWACVRALCKPWKSIRCYCRRDRWNEDSGTNPFARRSRQAASFLRETIRRHLRFSSQAFHSLGRNSAGILRRAEEFVESKRLTTNIICSVYTRSKHNEYFSCTASVWFTYETSSFFFNMNRSICEAKVRRSFLRECSFISLTFRNCLCSEWEENLALVPNFVLRIRMKRDRGDEKVWDLLEFFQCFILQPLIVSFITPFEISNDFAQQIPVGGTKRSSSIDTTDGSLLLSFCSFIRSHEYHISSRLSREHLETGKSLFHLSKESDESHSVCSDELADRYSSMKNSARLSLSKHRF